MEKKLYTLTVAVPTFNMEWCLEKNLKTFCDRRLLGRLEVICLNNASTDNSKTIIQRYVQQYPQMFKLRDWVGERYLSVNGEGDTGSTCHQPPNDSDWIGYGSAINDAISIAGGKYFRIVDADDWVDTEELVRLVDQLEGCEADVVLTDYQIVNLQSGTATHVSVSADGAAYGWILDVKAAASILPSTHSTTYRTGLLRESAFRVQEGLFFVDEEYVILPYLHVRSVLCYPFDIYRYQVADPRQSTSPRNRAKYHRHREQVLRRLFREYAGAKKGGAEEAALAYCFERIRRGVGDHFTTLYMYVADRQEGRRLAKEWRECVQREGPEFWPPAAKKAALLAALNWGHVSLAQYETLKRFLTKFTRRRSLRRLR